MNKIRSIAQLRTEQLRLARQRRGLEDRICEDWKNLRHAFGPAEYTRDALSSGLSWLCRRIKRSQKTVTP